MDMNKVVSFVSLHIRRFILVAAEAIFKSVNSESLATSESIGQSDEWGARVQFQCKPNIKCVSWQLGSQINIDRNSYNTQGIQHIHKNDKKKNEATNNGEEEKDQIEWFVIRAMPDNAESSIANIYNKSFIWINNKQASARACYEFPL